MPELPEVEVICRRLAPKIRGVRIREIWASGKKLRRQLSPADLEHLPGRQITDLSRRGKYLLLHLEDHSRLLVHLGMTGRLLLQTDSCQVPPHSHYIFRFGDGRQLIFQDIRRFGQLALYPPDMEPEIFRQLGPEPFDPELTPAQLAARAAGQRRPVKNLLLDGHFLAGLGNIYACEILFATGIHPRTPAGELSGAAWERLLQETRRILTAAIAAGGTTVANFADCEGQTGWFALQLQVYGRAGEPCRRCGAPISREVLAGRSTFFCPVCQPRRQEDENDGQIQG